MPSLARPSLISAAVMAAPLSLMAARGRPRFCIACDRPCAMFSADSARYHCRWHASRERSSSTPNRIGVRHSPRGVSTLRDPWWQSQCQSPPTYSASKLRTSRASSRATDASAPSVWRVVAARRRVSPLATRNRRTVA